MKALVHQGPGVILGHRLERDGMLAADDTFGRAAETKALKVIIER